MKVWSPFTQSCGKSERVPSPQPLDSWGASHSDQIQQQGGLEGPVELQGLIPKQVL